MQIAYHFGAHCTDEDRLLKCLFKNQGALADRGIIVTGPQRYRTQLRKAVDELRGMPASSAKQAELLRDIDIPEGTERLIFSHSAFFSSAGGAMGLGRFYPRRGSWRKDMRGFFPNTSATSSLPSATRPVSSRPCFTKARKKISPVS